MQPDGIMQILRIHAYETDFRRRIRGSDQVEYFFDVKDDAGIDSPPGELLFTSITAGSAAFRGASRNRATTRPTPRSTTSTAPSAFRVSV